MTGWLREFDFYKNHKSIYGSNVSGSIRAESIAASRMEKTLSDLASSLNSSFQPRAGPERSWVILAQIWLNLGKVCQSTISLEFFVNNCQVLQIF